MKKFGPVNHNQYESRRVLMSVLVVFSNSCIVKIYITMVGLLLFNVISVNLIC